MKLNPPRTYNQEKKKRIEKGLKPLKVSEFWGGILTGLWTFITLKTQKPFPELGCRNKNIEAWRRDSGALETTPTSLPEGREFETHPRLSRIIIEYIV